MPFSDENEKKLWLIINRLIEIYCLQTGYNTRSIFFTNDPTRHIVPEITEEEWKWLFSAPVSEKEEPSDPDVDEFEEDGIGVIDQDIRLEINREDNENFI